MRAIKKRIIHEYTHCNQALHKRAKEFNLGSLIWSPWRHMKKKAPPTRSTSTILDSYFQAQTQRNKLFSLLLLQPLQSTMNVKPVWIFAVLFLASVFTESESFFGNGVGRKRTTKLQVKHFCFHCYF